MITLYARLNRLLRIFHGCNTKVLIELGRSYCGSFYCSYLWTQFNKSTISKIRVSYNDLYRKILHISRRSGAISRCLLKIIFLTLNRYFEKKLFHLFLD